MILRRLSENLRAQNWTAIAIEFVIVVIGVFLGTQVSNWNQERLEKLETQRMLDQLIPELRSQIGFFESAKAYYTSSRGYADQLISDRESAQKLSDGQFIIAAYQASQIYGIGTNAENWALTFGGDQLRDIDDPMLRRNLAVVMTADYEAVDFDSVATAYRERVRRIIPIAIQDQIRERCGDRDVEDDGGANFVTLPASCPLELNGREATATAEALRSDRQLMVELRWHLAAVATYLDNGEVLERQMRRLHNALEHRS